MSSNNILIVDSKVVDEDYKKQQRVHLDAQANNLLEEIDCELNGFNTFKEQVLADTIEAKNRVDKKFKKAYS
jgi:hypothetical protein